MNKRSKCLISVVCVFLFASLACGNFPNPRRARRVELPQIDTQELPESLPDQVPNVPQPTAVSTATRVPRETVVVEEEQTGICRWEVYEWNPPSATTSNPNMTIIAKSFEVSTMLDYTVSGCDIESSFDTYHDWTYQLVFHPGDAYEMKVRFNWTNSSSPGCDNLIAGGMTTMTIGDFNLRVENMSINVKTDPYGWLSDTGIWIVPQGEVGDTFTIVAHASTGSYGTNARYHYKYTCE